MDVCALYVLAFIFACVFSLTRRTWAHCWTLGYQEEEPAAEDTAAHSLRWSRPYSQFPESNHSSLNHPSWASVLLGTVNDERDGHRNQHLHAGLDFLLPGNHQNIWDHMYCTVLSVGSYYVMNKAASQKGKGVNEGCQDSAIETDRPTYSETRQSQARLLYFLACAKVVQCGCLSRCCLVVARVFYAVKLHDQVNSLIAHVHTAAQFTCQFTF